MEQGSNFRESPSPTSAEQRRPSGAQPHPLKITQATDLPGDPSHGPAAHHPRNRPSPPLSSKPGHQDTVDMSEDAHLPSTRRPWSSPDPDPTGMAPYSSQEGWYPQSSHHPDPSFPSSSSKTKDNMYFYSPHHLNPASALYRHSFPTDEPMLPLATSPPFNNLPLHVTQGINVTHGYLNPAQDRFAGSVPHHGAFSETDNKMPSLDKITGQESDDNHNVDHPPEPWFSPAGPPDWHHRYDLHDHSVRSSHPYRDPPYPYIYPYHHYRPPGPGMVPLYGPHGWSYRYNYGPRSYMRYDPQPWSRPVPNWDYVTDSRYSERDRYSPSPPEYRGDSFRHPRWVQKYPYHLAHNPSYDPQGSPLVISDAPRPRPLEPQEPQEPGHQEHYTAANDSYSGSSSHYEGMELRRHQSEYYYRGEAGYGSGTAPLPPTADASASRAKSTPTSVTMDSATQRQPKQAVGASCLQTKQEPVVLQPRPDERYLQEWSHVLAPEQTPDASRAHPRLRGSSESLLQETFPVPIAVPGVNHPVQAISPEYHKRDWPTTDPLLPRLKTNPGTDFPPTPLPSSERPGYRAVPPRDRYSEVRISDKEVPIYSLARYDRDDMRTQRLDGQLPRSPMRMETRGRTGSLPDYLAYGTQGFRDSTKPFPPPATGSPSGVSSHKSTAISLPSPSGSAATLLMAAQLSTSSLSPPPVKLGQEGYYRQKDLEKLFGIWKSEYEQSLSQNRSRSGHVRRGVRQNQHLNHQHRHVTEDEDDGEDMDESHYSSDSNNDTAATTTGPPWREEAKWKWNETLEEFEPDGKTWKTMSDPQRLSHSEEAEELVDEHGRNQPLRSKGGREEGPADELEDDPMGVNEDSEEENYELDLRGETSKRRTESTGESSETGSSHEAQDESHHNSPDSRHHGTSHRSIELSGTSMQSDASSAPMNPNAPVAAPAKKRRIRVRESKNHWCEQCGKRFSRPSQLLTHSFTHSGEKPHQCHMCYKHFNVASNLKRHIRTHANSHRKASQIGNTVFRGFAIGYPTTRISNAQSTSITTTKSASTRTKANPSQGESSTDYNHSQPGPSAAQGHSILANIRHPERPEVKHPLVQADSIETSKSDGSSSGSGSSTGRIPVMPPPSAPSNQPESTPSTRKSPEGRV